MQIQKRRTFAIHHLILSAIALCLLASGATLAIASIVGGGSTPSRASSVPAVIQPASDEQAKLNRARRGLDAGVAGGATAASIVERLRGTGVGLDPGNVSSRVIARDWGAGAGLTPGVISTAVSESQTIHRTWGLGVGLDPGSAAGQQVDSLPNPDFGPTRR